LIPQQQEIDNYTPQPGAPAEIGEITVPPVVGLVPESPPKGQNNLAAALFAWPGSWGDALQCFSTFILILVVLYILGSVIRNVLYEDAIENVLKRFLAKWITINVGLVIAIIWAYLIGKYCIILPLIIALLIGLIWTLSYKKHKPVRVSVKSWYLVFAGRARTIWNNTKRRVKDELTLVDNSEG